MTHLLPRLFRFALALAIALSINSAVLAQSGPVSYQVTLDKNPTTHFLHIAAQVNRGGAPSIDVTMPAWSPGSYNIHNAWRNVQEFSATDESGAPLKFEKIDK